jgi:hypothetical protein
MSLKKLGVMLAAVLALGALGASTASAAVTTKAAEWYTGTTEAGVTTLVGSKVINAAVAVHPEIGSKGRLKGTVGANKVPITITSTGISCVECTIENKEVTGKAGKVAYGSGKIRFTGVTADTPTGCTVSSEAGVAGEILTRKLVIHGDWMAEGNEHAFIQFIPEAGETAAFAQLKLSGGECTAIAGPYNVTGTVFGESVNNTGKAATAQQAVFSPAIQTTAGASLKLGGNAAEFTGTGSFSLASGEFFAIK